jgi:hypothetical protein
MPDFQNLDDENRLRLICAGTLQDLEQQGIELREGMALTFYTDDANDKGQPDELLADGIVRFNKADNCWEPEIDWNAIRQYDTPPKNLPRVDRARESQQNGTLPVAARLLLSGATRLSSATRA